jgi:hypothetical protein
MTTLEERIRRMTPPPVPVTPVADLQVRASRRRNRRRVVIGLCTVAVLALVVGLLRTSADDASVNVGPTPSDPTPTQRTIGDVTGVTVDVTPSTGLVDGQIVRVRIDGLDRLPGAQIAMCRGDVEDLAAATSCDGSAIEVVGNLTVQAFAEQDVVVSARLELGEDGTEVGYDCATEPAGCVLIVAAGPPIRSVLVPLSFATGSRVPFQPAMSVDSATGLTDGSVVQVMATGLRPNRTYQITQCTTDEELVHQCWNNVRGTVVADGGGALTAPALVYPMVLSPLVGAVDCTEVTCVLQVEHDVEGVLAWAPLSFAPGVETTLPSLTIEPAGPYFDGQVVTVSGIGFPPGAYIPESLARCPSGVDTRYDRRCTNVLDTGTTVARDGRFTVAVTLREAGQYGSCLDEPGCVLAWVIPNGPTVAEVPLPFSD